ncbi:MAG: hypothetical protein ACRENE_33420 [Polyangiaceae bacterium]
MRAGGIALALVVIVAAGGYALLRSGRAPAPIARTLHEVASSVASSAAAVASAYEPTDPPDAAPDASEVWVRQNGPLSNTQLGAPLVHGTFVTECGAPDTMHVTIKVNVKFGRATGVDVKTTPPDKTIAACIDHAIRDKHWDVSPKAGHVSVTY